MLTGFAECKTQDSTFEANAYLTRRSSSDTTKMCMNCSSWNIICTRSKMSFWKIKWQQARTHLCKMSKVYLCSFLILWDILKENKTKIQMSNVLLSNQQVINNYMFFYALLNEYFLHLLVSLHVHSSRSLMHQ